MWFSIASTRFITMLCTTAVEGIKAQIKRFVDDGGTAAHFAKAIECLRTMRAGCLSNYEEAAFNDFMKALKAEYESGVRVTQHALVNAVIVPDVACVLCTLCAVRMAATRGLLADPRCDAHLTDSQRGVPVGIRFPRHQG